MAKEQQQPNKIRLFISYSRRDFGKTEKLYEALSGDDELDVYLDQHDIAAAEDWKQRLDGLIRSSDTILFAVSRDSVASDICQWEIDLATQLNKRIIPVIINDVADEDVPEEIARLNYVFARTDKELIPALESIGDALKIDIDWIREHTRLADMAHRWEQASKLGAQPLRGKELEAAEQWLSNQPNDAPAPTELQRKYIYESRKSATKRQRMTVMGSIAAMLIVGVLAGFAFVQRNAAIEGERRAEEALRTATEAANTMVLDLAREFLHSPVPSKIIESILEKARKLQDTLGESFEYDTDLQRSKAGALRLMGDIYINHKSIDEASTVYEESLSIARKLNALGENNVKLYYDLSASLERVGDVKLLTGDIDGALKAYEEKLELSRKLVALDENNSVWQEDLIISLSRIGGAKLRSGDAQDALTAFEEGYEVARKLASSDESNVEWQRSLLGSLNKIGDVKRYTGDQESALKTYEEGLVLSRRNTELDENNTQWQRDLSVSLNRVGHVKLRLGDTVGALKIYQEGLEINRKLAALHEDNTQWQHDLNVSLGTIAGFKLRAGDEEGALKLYEESLEIGRKLVSLDERNSLWQRSLSVSLESIADIKQRSGDVESALEAYEEGLEIARKLAALDETNSQWQRDLAISLETIADIKMDAGDEEGALKAHEEGLELSRKLVAVDENNMKWQHDLGIGLNQIGNFKLRTGDEEGALKAFEEGLEIARKLASLDETNTKWQQSLSISYFNLSKLYSQTKDFEKSYAWGKKMLNHTSALVERFPQNKDISNHKLIAQEKLATPASGLAFKAIIEENYKRAEELSREAISLNSKSVWMKSSLAHALMFQDKTDEARALYLKHRGEAINDKFSWEQAILSDFKDLRKKGLTHPMMDEIEALFKKKNL